MNDPVNRSDQAGLDDDELPFYELSLDDIFALVDGGGGGGGGDYAFDEFLDVFAEDEPIVQQFPPPTAPIPIGPIGAGGPPPGLGTVPIPNLPPPPSPSASALYDRAFRRAIQALQRGRCQSIFNLPSGITPAELLAGLSSGGPLGSISFGDLGAPDANGSVTAAATNQIGHQTVTLPNGTTVVQALAMNIGNIVINTNAQAPFIAGYGTQALSQNDQVNRAITLIHELGHAANFIYGPDASLINQSDTGPDAQSRRTNRANSRLVYERCF